MTHQTPLERLSHAPRTRRSVLRNAGLSAAGAFAFSSSQLVDALSRVQEALGAQPEATPDSVVYIRPNIHSLDPNGPELASYATAVRKMRLLDEDNPLSWNYQAAIHGTLLDASKWHDLYFTCEHHTDFFWPWHRMFLYWFEQIIRDQSANPDFALPYWDYSNPSQQYLPAPFRQPGHDLYVERRSANANKRDETSLPVIRAMFDYCAGLAQPIFGNWASLTPGASTRIEQSVHDPIHGWVGGRSALGPGIMSIPQTSALDPVFYLHHTNMDRLWSSWKSITLDAADHQDPVDSVWLDQSFDFFDQTGAKVMPAWTTSSVADTTLSPLGYVYEALADNAWFESTCSDLQPLAAPPAIAPPATPGAGGGEIANNADQGSIEIGAEPVVISLTPQGPGPDFDATPEATSPGSGQTLVLEGITGTGVSAVTIEVYINLPEGVSPSYPSPYFAGNIAMFGLGAMPEGHHGDDHGSAQAIDLSTVIAGLNARGEWNGDIVVTFLPVDLNESDLGTTEGDFAEATPEAVVPIEGPWLTIERVAVTTR